MTVRKAFYIVILQLYCIPYAYSGIYLELAGWGLWGYFIAVAMGYILSSQAAKLDNKYVVFAGNVISLSASLYCVRNFITERWWSFCKPFTPAGAVLFYTVFIVLSSFAGWLIEKEILYRKSKKNKKSAG